MPVENVNVNLQTQCPECGTIMHSTHDLCPACVLEDALSFVPESPTVFTSNTDTDFGSVTLDYLRPSPRAGRLGMLAHYEMIEVIGVGGMGVVFRALDTKLNRTVAVKILKPELAPFPAARERFVREARAAAAIEHENVVTIHEVGEDRNIPYLAMPFLQGQSLQEYLRRSHVLSVGEILAIGKQIAAGLAAAHDQNVIHRDIKPGNIWLEQPDSDSESGVRVKILDFGLARSVTSEPGFTRNGEILGTPAYMAPEQAQGKPVDQRCDLFSLGCVLYQMCVGDPPFPGEDTMSVLMSLATRQPVPPHEKNSAIPFILSELILRMLAKDPVERPGSALEVVDAMVEIETAPNPSKQQNPVAEVLVRKHADRLTIAIAVFLLILVPSIAIFGGTVIRFASNKGELVLDVQDPNIEVNIRHNGVEVRDENSQRVFWLTPGDGEITVVEKNGVGPLLTKRFALNRGGTTTVSVTVQEMELARNPPIKPPVVADANIVNPATWPNGNGIDVLPGLIPFPTELPTKQRWQIFEQSAAAQSQTAQWSPDGQWIAVRTAFPDRTFHVRLYEGGSKKFVRVLWTAHGGAGFIQWSPDSRWLGIASHQQVRFFRADGTPGANIDTVRHFDVFRWSPDNTHLLGFQSLQDDHHLIAMNTETGKGVLLQCHEGGVRDARWSPDGKWLATAGKDKTAKLWKPDGTPGPVLAGHTGAVSALSWHPKDGRLATASTDGTVRLWNTDGKASLVLEHDRQPARDCQWSREGKHLATATAKPGTAGGNVRIWDDAGKLVRTHFGEMAFSNPESQFRFQTPTNWRPDDKGVVVYRRNKDNYQQFDVISLPVGTEPPSLITDVPGDLSWSPNGKNLLIWGEPGRHGFVHLIRLEGTAFTRMPIEHFFRVGVGYPASVSWNPDSNSFVLGLAADRVTQRAGGGLLVFQADGRKARSLIDPSVIRKLAISPQGDRFATGEMFGRICIWRMDGLLLHSWTTESVPNDYSVFPANAIADLSWHPDGRFLASCDYDQVSVWDSESGKLKVKTKVPTRNDRTAFAAFSPKDGRILAISGNEKSALWKWDTENPPQSWFDNHNTGAITWSSDGGRFAASAGLSTTIRIWKSDGTPESEIQSLQEMEDQFSPVAWNPVGTRLLVASSRQMRVVERTGKTERQFGSGMNIAWSPDGKSIVGVPYMTSGGPKLYSPDGKPGLILEPANCTNRHPWNMFLGFTPDSRKLLVASGSRIAIWDAATGKLDRIIVLLAQGKSAVFSPAGELLFASPGAKEDLIYILEQAGGKLETLDSAAFEKLRRQ